jgi:hypothetical protein
MLELRALSLRLPGAIGVTLPGVPADTIAALNHAAGEFEGISHLIMLNDRQVPYRSPEQ